jgi:hypothetical protein
LRKTGTKAEVFEYGTQEIRKGLGLKGDVKKTARDADWGMLIRNL